MPRAIRKSYPDAPSPPNPVATDPVATGKRAATAVGTRAMLDAMRDHNGPDASLGCKARIVDWHSAVAQVSGTLVVACGARGITREAARAAVDQLRACADDMERRLLT